ncbi:hypothetical protein IX321_001528 [Bacteroides pyogenes]|nr:hypothetical protein [Bacteroides pyogenes]MBR8717379.1 hypothetical protein [Bacteroides pyogenes]MBR8746994.1 hypothetical protein [Bacteroides pyogenes]MBR8757370.1 hypothetical protein [Bacteroides pyogenes]MBR8780596.1 hypothetical protein [Bacteroides pyogenes]
MADSVDSTEQTLSDRDKPHSEDGTLRLCSDMPASCGEAYLFQTLKAIKQKLQIVKQVSFPDGKLLFHQWETFVSPAGNFCFPGGKLLFHRRETFCFIKREPLFHQKRASVLSKESLCFIEREPLFHRSRASVSPKRSFRSIVSTLLNFSFPAFCVSKDDFGKYRFCTGATPSASSLYRELPCHATDKTGRTAPHLSPQNASSFVNTDAFQRNRPVSVPFLIIQ